MLEWTTAYSSREHGNTAADVKSRLDAFNAYKTGTKPEWKARFAGLEGLYNTFVSSCRNNNRPIYMAPEGLGLSTIEATWKVGVPMPRSGGSVGMTWLTPAHPVSSEP